MSDKAFGMTAGTQQPDLSAYAVGSIALQMLDDLHQSDRHVKRCAPMQTGLDARRIRNKLVGLGSGKLVVVGTRSEQLGDALMLQLAYEVSTRQAQVVHVYSPKASVLGVARKYVDAMSVSNLAEGIYGGQLKYDESELMAQVLGKLTASRIFVNPCRFSAEEISEFLLNAHRDAGKPDLVIVNDIRLMVGNDQVLDISRSLPMLRQLARDLLIPIVAIDQLDPKIDGHETTLTRNELRVYEELAKHVDGLMLLSGSVGDLVLATPKISLN